ncbi:MAG: hypothetical protein M1837_007268 [Sclerophora amabilis]|nr:MAG: hypothetical protein M1837_007268 [Sclerophora amabilis]
MALPGPCVRLLVDTFYNYRISKISAQLEQLHKEREKTIDKLKAATKYNSTQQLLDKYGGGSPQSPSASSSSTKRKSGRGKESPGVPKGPQQRTHILPPPTANVPRNNLPPNVPSTPQSQSKDTKNAIAQQNNSPSLDSARSTPNQRRPGSQPDSPGFAPNAYAVPPQYSSTTDLSQPHWYDRVLDLLLGEDETLPKNRYALICKECRLVNGQAPPGTKSLEDIGRWRCASCGAWNGDQAETTKLLDEMKERAKSEVETQKAVSKSEAPPSPVESNEDVVAPPASEDVISEVDTRREDTEEDVSDQGQEAAQDEEEKEDAGEEEKEPTPKAKRGRPKGSGKKKKG